MKYQPFMLELWELTGEIGTIAETDDRYVDVYRALSDAFDRAEENELILSEEYDD